MGADVMLFVQVDGCCFPKADLSELDISSIYERGNSSFEGPPNSRWEINCLDRYYGPGYERGSWPRIREAIDRLRKAPNVKAVWYCSDYCDGESAPLVTDKLLAEYDAHYEAVGNEPYNRVFLEV
jgi:hypothetical protein